MKITIDGKDILIKDVEKNIVEIADENGITITAPCFRNGRKGGCCKACVIEVDGIQKYACGSKPQNAMNIIYNREDLASLRKERLETYAQAIKSGDTVNSCCSSDSQNLTSDSCGCSSSSCCG